MPAQIDERNQHWVEQSTNLCAWDRYKQERDENNSSKQWDTIIYIHNDPCKCLNNKNGHNIDTNTLCSVTETVICFKKNSRNKAYTNKTMPPPPFFLPSLNCLKVSFDVEKKLIHRKSKHTQTIPLYKYCLASQLQQSGQTHPSKHKLKTKVHTCLSLQLQPLT
jgi:hypothetical protein